MKKHLFASLIILVLILSSFAFSESHYRYIQSPKSDIYFGHISYADVKHDGKDPVVIREGDALPEVAVINFPIAPGDTIRTTESRRCEIQFDTGTIVRLDYNTELKVETILAQSLSSRKKISNLVLNKGQIYIMYKRYYLREIFQVLSSNTAVKLNHKAVAFLKAREDGSTDVQVKAGKVIALYGPDEESLNQKALKKSQEWTISKDHKLEKEKYLGDIDFVMWNEEMNENFMELHEGVSAVPKPIQRLPKAVFYFAQKYSNIYGEWVWSDLYGYVWRPHYNDHYPWGNWQPYFYGRWSELNGQLFWVPEESWGWVPYHLGLWVWNKKLGWLWIPGSAFAPAWAAWDFYGSHYAWRPWSLWDWYYYDYGLSGLFNRSYYPEYYAYEYLGDMYDSVGGKKKETITKIRKDQLKKGKSPYSLPKDMKKVYKNVVLALKKGDLEALDPIRKSSEHMVFVKRSDLNSRRIQDKSLRFSQFTSKEKSGFASQDSLRDPYREAVNAYRRNDIISMIEKFLTFEKSEKAVEGSRSTTAKQVARNVRGSIDEGEVIGKRSRFSRESSIDAKRPVSRAMKKTSTTRFRDLNPDVKVAMRRGVSIKYSSRSNEIQCPKLGLSSSNVITRRGFSSRISTGGFYSSSSSGGGNSSGSTSVSSSSSSSSSGARSSGTRSSSSSKGSSGSGGKKK